MVVKLAEIFKSGDPEIALRHTRLILLSTDGEENGQRGSLHYAESHKDELRATKTYVFSLDSLYRLRDLAFLTTETNGLVRLRRAQQVVVEEFVQKSAGLAAILDSLPFPFSSTSFLKPFSRCGLH